MRHRKSKRNEPWVKASGTTARGKLRRFEVWLEGDSYRIHDLQTFHRWSAESDRRATEEDVRSDLEDEFRLSNVTIERVKFQDLPSGGRIRVD
jgi:hypothetical protein